MLLRTLVANVEAFHRDASLEFEKVCNHFGNNIEAACLEASKAGLTDKVFYFDLRVDAKVLDYLVGRFRDMDAQYKIGVENVGFHLSWGKHVRLQSDS